MMTVDAEEPRSGFASFRAAASLLPAPCRARPYSPHDVLDHDHRIVDDKAHGRRHPPKGHDVEAHVKHVEEHDRRGQNGGHGDDGDEGDPEASQKNEQNEGRQDDADEHGVPHARNGRGDKLALIVPVPDLDASAANWFRNAASVALESPGNAYRVASGLLVDVARGPRR